MTQQWNSSQTSANITLSGSPPLTATANTDAAGITYGSEGVTSASVSGGQVGFYWEIRVSGSGYRSGVDNSGVGLGNTSSITSGFIGVPHNQIGWFPDGNWISGNVTIGTAATYDTTGGLTVTLCFALDVVNNLIYGRNGISGNWNSNASANPATQTGGVSITQATMTVTASPMVPGVQTSEFTTSPTDVVVGVFAQSSWQGTAPSGFGPFDPVAASVNRSGLLAMSIISRHAINVTPSDTADLPSTSDYLSFTNSGTQTIQITTLGGETLTITGLATNVLHPVRAKRVWSTGTTVTNIVAYWT